MERSRKVVAPGAAGRLLFVAKMAEAERWWRWVLLHDLIAALFLLFWRLNESLQKGAEGRLQSLQKGDHRGCHLAWALRGTSFWCAFWDGLPLLPTSQATGVKNTPCLATILSEASAPGEGGTEVEVWEKGERNTLLSILPVLCEAGQVWREGKRAATMAGTLEAAGRKAGTNWHPCRLTSTQGSHSAEFFSIVGQ